MGLLRQHYDMRDMREPVVKDITDLLYGSQYFNELSDALKSAMQGYGPEQEVLIAKDKDTKDKFKMADIIKAVETLRTYVHDNKEMLKTDPDQIERYLKDQLPATAILSKNEDLMQTAIRCAKNAQLQFRI